MRAFRILQLVVLSVLVGSTALIYAQDEKTPEDKPSQEETKTPKQDDAKPAKQQDEAKPSKQDKQEEKQDKKMNQSHDQMAPAGQGQSEKQMGNGHPAGKGGHIPDDKFKAHFGRSHTFKAQTVIVSGQPQFSYGGYSFELVDAWPVGWAYTDECYIDYIDGEYFLFDLAHPGVRIAVFVVL
jgi:hypothetical protein